MIRTFLLMCFMCAGITVAAQVTYGDDESRYVLGNPPEWKVTGNTRLPFDESGNTRYSLSGLGDNWFLGASVGDAVFIGSPKGCGDFFDRSKFSAGAYLGKWFSPYFGVRAKYQGWELKDGNMDNTRYHHIHGDLMLNISSFFHRSSFETGPRWNVSPFVGAGLFRNGTLDNNSFAINYGVLISHRVVPRVNIDLELSGLTAKKSWDGLGKGGFGDGLYTASIGLSVNLGKVGWRVKQSKAVASSYLDDRDLNSYGSYDNGYKLNDYSGINSLRKRLKGMKEKENEEDGSFMAPVLFFFKINTTTLVDKQQTHNLDEIARAVNEYDLKLKIVGAADSHTGNKKWNRKLSIERAKYIAKCLIRRGVSKERMIGASLGGVDIYKPYPANRHTCVIVYKDKLDSNDNGYDYGK